MLVVHPSMIGVPLLLMAIETMMLLVVSGILVATMLSARHVTPKVGAIHGRDRPWIS